MGCNKNKNFCRNCTKYRRTNDQYGLCLNSRSHVFERKVSSTYACDRYSEKDNVQRLGSNCVAERDADPFAR